jgi:hypothetical protein
VAAFKKYSAERQIGYKLLLAKLTEKGILLGVLNKRLSKGMKAVAPAVRVLELDASKDDFVNMDGYVAETKDANRDSQLPD